MYGFRGLCSDFLSSHPGHHVNPRRVNGSAVETLFGQLKHTTGGNLTSCNYSTAKATMLTKRAIHGRKLKDDYRDTPLCVRQPELKRKKKGIRIVFLLIHVILCLFLRCVTFQFVPKTDIDINSFFVLNTGEFSNVFQEFIASCIIKLC